MFLIFYFLLLLVSFYLLARVCDGYFIESLDKIAKKIKMSSEMAGATLMAVGTSAPELFVSIIALIKPGGHEAVGAGTIVGSAIFNILVIIGASAVVRKAILTWQPVVRDTLFYVISIVALLLSFRDGKVDLMEAIFFVVLYGVYVTAVINWRKILRYKEQNIIEKIEKEIKKERKNWWAEITKPFDWVLDKFFPNAKHYYWIFWISIAMIVFLSWVLVESAVAIAHILNISEAIIALTILAAGTSIPDLMSSIIVARQGRGDMAISNAVGSNIFDILFGLGAPWLIVLSFRGGVIPVDTESLWSSVILLFATVLVIFFLLLVRKWKIGHRAGYFLIALYVLYILWAISRVI